MGASAQQKSPVPVAPRQDKFIQMLEMQSEEQVKGPTFAQPGAGGGRKQTGTVTSGTYMLMGRRLANILQL